MRARAVLSCWALLALSAAVPHAVPAQAAARSTEITWHGNQIDMYDARAAGRSGQGVVVAVIDGWVDGRHPDFQGRVLQGGDCTSGRCVAGQGRDACTHGSHVAGTVASSSFGVAPRARILPVRVLVADGDGDCTGSPSDVADAIRFATAKGARVINLSLGPLVPGLSQSSEIPGAVADAARAGVVVIFAAGNQDLPLAESYGGNALVVAATNPSGSIASYSQYGAGVDVAAPGGESRGGRCTQASCVTSLFPDGQYAVAAGTSMAAPHVAGVAALLVAQQPGRSRQSVMNRITSTARPLAGAGSGRVDARAALGARAAAPRPTTTSRGPVVVGPRTPPPPKAARPAPPARKPAGPRSPAARPTTAPAPGASPTAAPIDPPPLALGTGRGDLGDEIPTSLIALAGALAGLGALGVVAAGRRYGLGR